MDIEYAEKYGEALLDYAFDMLFLRETCGVNHAEFIFVRVADLLNEYDKLKPWFLENVQTTLEGNFPSLAAKTRRPVSYVPEELVEYIAHVTKWPEFNDMALNELKKHEGDEVYLMNRNLPASILEALENEWEDIDMYESLQNI